ncbi:hypothetical protein XBKQ1_1410010 [Xenorhabdus bovienii str. kraussei Quebec]|uniref:Uncharacterized protein n=4 Tax=Xenorhabdus bovienii TaxID=40576 RepID=A0A077PDD2_XENBV|nr:hypothetical protein XBFFR1_1670007 [Xenorhabdus bovienii str. feltiae France]CDG92541.1 hypothetical protein XBFFL1_2220019 [Xenorhabdus bovienii str. feltiae Florida]CDG99250.1 hypothetical protein XBP1_840007 [Xenorhabdus bovienii str. puntauvense]CDH01639.1 hypothetical protein XBFM1_2260008 [Xenorhabdus bovienii str. feltiae Moldova]CDH18632.1 hypothetical protein XBKQ1_1410010 [Xenorhabdus bovienii str. kraussei Quebec]CDH23930.1 hypothetical protein XBKB1_2200007 [Xenorhabdus bovieni
MIFYIIYFVYDKNNYSAIYDFI